MGCRSGSGGQCKPTTGVNACLRGCGGCGGDWQWRRSNNHRNRAFVLDFGGYEVAELSWWQRRPEQAHNRRERSFEGLWRWLVAAVQGSP